MIVKCVYNKGVNLSVHSLTEGNTKQTEFNLKIENYYTVYGICIYKNVCNYLISPSAVNYVPLWYPAELFEIVDHLFPIEWYFDFKGYNSDISAIWGYKELISNENYNDNLMERDDDAMTIFIKRSKEIDEYCELVKYTHRMKD